MGLSNPAKRKIYNKDLHNGQRFNGIHTPDQVYDNYRDAFDATVSGLSEAELATAVGTVAALAGLVGAAIGSRMSSSGGGESSGGRTTRSTAGTTARGTSSSLVGSAASMVGGLVAAELASSSVRALHQDSVNRISYKEECQRALERGEPMPPRPKTSFKMGKILKKTMDSASSSSSSRSNTTNNNEQNPEFHSFPDNTNTDNDYET